ncbi:Chloramphenicol acetyltransferase-like domain protein [Niveomyces insectorum RCEF 264]|uniref:Chloramphenicol acetyltransferase-like domain protein n=1 Tax=Niveomyces insectorum RCEF 264 TaxID=1081102 RepID=A0A167YQ19_9HYPO|nr:Chloramphenicol acetyltransferase-like domain protein [Niveomyces insectorum RCEF 264]
MFSFLSGQPKAPPRIPTDVVVPVGFFDNTIIFRTFVLYTLFVFDDVLDPQKLHESLEQLDAGELEHHIPAFFSQDRPAIAFDHVNIADVAVEHHPVGSQIPHPPRHGRPAIVGDPDNLSTLIHGPNIPTRQSDYTTTDRPQLGLRVISFQNATVVVLHWLHLTFDATAKRSLLDAWTLMLQGREHEIPEPLAPDNYILEHCGKKPTERHVLADLHVSTPGLVWWALQNVYNLAIRPQEHRMVCVPAAYLAKLRETALAELRANAHAGDDGNEMFVSEGDVLVAWFARLAISNLPRDSERTIAVQQAYQWRTVLTDLIPDNRPFLSNCVGFLVTLLPAKDILQKPLSSLASNIRKSIREQGSREQVEAYTALIREDPSNRAPPFFGNSSMQLLMLSNWQKANMYGTDLSAATARPRTTPLTPSFVQSAQGPYSFSDGIIIVGKDAEGNYWLSGNRAKGLWGQMAKMMEEEVLP